MTPIIIAGVVGIVIGLLIGWLLASTRNAQIRAELAVARKTEETDREKLAWVDQAEDQLRNTFQALAAKVLASNSETFSRQTRDQMEGLMKQIKGDWSVQKEQFSSLVNPVEKSLQTLDQHVRTLEKTREGAYRSLEQHLKELKTAHQSLRDETGHLRSALTISSRSRGQWGELQLRRIVEQAGMLNHVDFEEQEHTADGQRPDMVIRMPNEGILPVDAKTSLEAYLQAVEANTDEERRQKLKAHAQAMRNHVRTLSSKAYWKQFPHTPEVVVMFVPNEACLGAAFEEDPQLMEYGLEQHVLVATPVTMFGLLKTIAYGWQQQSIAENAHEIAEEGKILCDRLDVFLDHLSKTGKGLDAAVRSYNNAVGSVQNRLIPSARRFKDLGATTRDLDTPPAIETQSRLPDTSAPPDAPEA